MSFLMFSTLTILTHSITITRRGPTIHEGTQRPLTVSICPWILTCRAVWLRHCNAKSYHSLITKLEVVLNSLATKCRRSHEQLHKMAYTWDKDKEMSSILYVLELSALL